MSPHEWLTGIAITSIAVPFGAWCLSLGIADILQAAPIVRARRGAGPDRGTGAKMDKAMNDPCPNCHGALWVCEDHPDKPWDDGSPAACTCGAAGMPCPKCNPAPDREHPPKMPAGWRTKFDKDGWRH